MTSEVLLPNLEGQNKSKMQETCYQKPWNLLSVAAFWSVINPLLAYDPSQTVYMDASCLNTQSKLKGDESYKAAWTYSSSAWITTR